MLTAITSTIVAVIVVRRNPDIVDLELFGPTQEENEDMISVFTHPILEFERIFKRKKDGEDCLQLMMRNTGQALVFESIRKGHGSEMEVRYLPLELRPSTEVSATPDEYPKGTSLTIFLLNRDPEKLYYDFLIKFKDLNGNYYRQRISGLGDKSPIIDAPKMSIVQPLPKI